MLAALLMAFFLGGSGGTFGAIVDRAMLEDVGDRLQQTVSDPAKAEQATSELKALRSELKRFEKVFSKSGKALTKSYKDHGANTIAIRTQLDTLNSEWESAQSRALDHRFAIREQMTRDEWRATFDAP